MIIEARATRARKGIALLITGQMLASVAFDHFGWLGLAPRAVDRPRLVGVALLIGGVALIRR